METNRVETLFSLANKNAAGKTPDKAAVGKSGGFADMLFSTMAQRSDAPVAGFGFPQLKLSTSASIRDGRGVPAGRTDATRSDNRLNANPDRVIDHNNNGKTPDETPVRAGWTTDNPPGFAVRAEHRPETKVHCADNATDASDVDELDSGDQIDPVPETDSAEDTQEGSLETGCGDSDSESEADQNSRDDQASDQAIAAAVTVTPAIVDVVAETSIAAVAATAPAATAETETENTALPAIAAATPLPDLDALSGTSTTPAGAADEKTTEDAPAAKAAITFAAVAGLTTAPGLEGADPETQKLALSANGEGEVDDPANLFRRSSTNGRKTPTVGQGATAGAQAAQQKTAATTPDLHAAVAQAAGVVNSPAATTTALNPLGIETSLGGQTAFPGWNIHLAQGAAIRRGDFVANLRQHLQNLPVQEQVALSIRRSVRDGGGDITLQLAPAELGRIHLKLKIDEENNVQASVTVERPATLELLQKDMKALERALQEAGLKAGPGDLSFSLQGGDPEAFARDFGQGNGNGSGGNGQAQGDGVDDATTATAAPVIATADGWVDVEV